jgi:hypothetical protein
VHQLRLLREQGLKQRSKAAVKKVLREVVPWVVARPKLKAPITKIAYKLGMADRLKPFARSLLTSHSFISHQESPKETTLDLTVLTPRARQIYKDLKQAIENNQKVKA